MNRSFYKTIIVVLFNNDCSKIFFLRSKECEINHLYMSFIRILNKYTSIHLPLLLAD